VVVGAEDVEEEEEGGGGGGGTETTVLEGMGTAAVAAVFIVVLVVVVVVVVAAAAAETTPGPTREIREPSAGNTRDFPETPRGCTALGARATTGLLWDDAAAAAVKNSCCCRFAVERGVAAGGNVCSVRGGEEIG